MKQKLQELIKKGVPFVLVGSITLGIPRVAKADNENIENMETVTETEATYLSKDGVHYAINLNQTPDEVFITKAKFLLGEDNYNNYYTNSLNKENIPELKRQFESMYGEGTFAKLKEFQYRTNGMSDDKLSIERHNIYMERSYTIRQKNLFPDSSYNETRENTIEADTIEMDAINTVLSNKKDMYDTLYEMNEFVTLCVGNALRNGKYANPNEIFEIYSNEILNPVFLHIVCSDGTIVDLDATNFGKYPNYNAIKNNPEEYGLESANKLTKTR